MAKSADIILGIQAATMLAGLTVAEAPKVMALISKLRSGDVEITEEELDAQVAKCHALDDQIQGA